MPTMWSLIFVGDVHSWKQSTFPRRQWVNSLIARSRGQHGSHLGPSGPRWVRCWPLEPYYPGCCITVAVTHPMGSLILCTLNVNHTLVIPLSNATVQLGISENARFWQKQSEWKWQSLQYKDSRDTLSSAPNIFWTYFAISLPIWYQEVWNCIEICSSYTGTAIARYHHRKLVM